MGSSLSDKTHDKKICQHAKKGASNSKFMVGMLWTAVVLGLILVLLWKSGLLDDLPMLFM